MSETPHTDVPTLVVVGRVNKGKSSVVATLTENATVKVSSKPGTTVSSREYAIKRDQTTLISIVDTPGFEEAPRALHWLQAHANTASERPGAVRAFLEEFGPVAGGDTPREFPTEVRLLTPIMDGGGVLYVIDATHPYRAPYEAEMEILRWTGQPRMALINRTGDEEHLDAWRTALAQYFDVVKLYNAHDATFDDRMAVLETFGALRDDWRPRVERTVSMLREERRMRDRDAAALIVRHLVDTVPYTKNETIKRGAPQEPVKKRLHTTFHQHIAKQHDTVLRALERIYNQAELVSDETTLAEDGLMEELTAELFSEDTFGKLGLSRGKLIAGGAAAGAVAGGVIDAGVGGASFGTGLVLGGLGGAAATTRAVGVRFAEASVPGLLSAWRSLGDDSITITIGPHPNPNLPWVLLDRALIHVDLVRRWSYARRDTDAAPEERAESRVELLPDEQRKSMQKLLAKLKRKGSLAADEENGLVSLVAQLVGQP